MEIIRNATIDDLNDIITLIEQLAVYEKMDKQVSLKEETLKYWLFERKIANVLLVEVNSKIVGFALFFYNFSTFLGKAGLYLEDLYVKAEYRGNGYGKKLLVALAKRAIMEDLGRIDWSCLNWNKPSIDFYHALGAIELDEWLTFRLDAQAIKALAG